MLVLRPLDKQLGLIFNTNTGYESRYSNHLFDKWILVICLMIIKVSQF